MLAMWIVVRTFIDGVVTIGVLAVWVLTFAIPTYWVQGRRKGLSVREWLDT